MTLAAAEMLTAEGNELFERHEFRLAATKFERATTVFPAHASAWKGLGHSLLCLDQPIDASRAFDRAIGLRGDSATALWGGALAHAALGHKLVAQNYLRRVLALQPSWLEMARSVPALAPFLELSSHAADLVRRLLGPYSSKAYLSPDGTRRIEVARIPGVPVDAATYVSIGLCDHVWLEPERPRMEIILASELGSEISGEIVANAAFALSATQRYPLPGTILPDLVGALAAGALPPHLRHLYFMVPRLWPRLELPLDVGPPTITLAQAVLIGEDDRQFIAAAGAPAFEAHLRRRRDPANLERVSD